MRTESAQIQEQSPKSRKQKTANDFPLVAVQWRDAFFDYDLDSVSEIRSDYLVQTVGFLIAEGPLFLSVAQEILPSGDGFRAVTHIPKAIVERVTRADPDEEP
jgi:hypothetical protein